MWQVDNRTPFAAEGGWVRDRNGAEVWLVAVKCSFDIAPDGTTEVSREQPPVLRAPEYHGPPGRSSIKYETDLVASKTTTDVLVVGCAHAPGGQAVTSLDVELRVADLQKRIRVHGDRRWEPDGPTPARPFVKMPLLYEHAFGGVDGKSDHPERDWDMRNPAGRGYAIRRAHLDGLPMPNIEAPDRPIMAWDDRPAPAGFGAIAGHWQPRASFAGTYDDHWARARQPLLPEDFDDRFFQCTPADQQTARFLLGGEPVTLTNLSPLGRLHFKLPRVHLGFETRFYDGSREMHRERKLHTVLIEPEFPRVSLVWHSALPCHFKVHKLERTLVTLKTDLSAGWSAADDTESERA